MNDMLFSIELIRVKEIFDTGILSDPPSKLTESALIETLIKLNSCLQYLSTHNKRINFTDDIPSGDITDLISAARNGACHIASGRNKIGTTTFVFNVVVGRCPNAFNIDGVICGSDYDNDIAFFYGTHKIYSKRHIARLLHTLELIN